MGATVLAALSLSGCLSPSPRIFQPIQGTKLPSVDAERAGSLLAEAVRFQTIATRDPRKLPAAEFRRFRSFLAQRFPRVHKAMPLTLIKGHTMIFKWEGREPKRAPTVLMGHYDVVPVSPSTLSSWEVPPFAGKIEGGFIWGRGTLDDKVTVIGLLHAAELLLAEGYQPRGTIYLVFGHDEEVISTGAAAAVAWFKGRGIQPAMVLDEGGSVLSGTVPGVKAPVVLIGTAEKGYLTLRLRASAEGGHSSMPPKSTAVGRLARAIHRLEQNQMPTRIDGALADFFRHVGPHMPTVLRLAVANLWLFQGLVTSELGASRAGNATLRTTTAATVIKGGVKENVLPERATALINFRLLPGDNADSVREHVRKTIDDDKVTIELVKYTAPTPVSPANSAAFELVGRVAKTIYPKSVVSPYLMIGATDAREYTAICNNVLRLVPVRMSGKDLDRMHGVNERVAVKDFADAVRFYLLLMKSL